MTPGRGGGGCGSGEARVCVGRGCRRWLGSMNGSGARCRESSACRSDQGRSGCGGGNHVGGGGGGGGNHNRGRRGGCRNHNSGRRGGGGRRRRCNLRPLLRLVNSHISDIPISLRELRRVASNEDGASLLARNSGTSIAPCGISKVTYERQKISLVLWKDHLPQKVLSKMMRLFLKLASMLALGPLKIADGSPHVSGSGVPEVISDGICPLGKNQILMASDSHCIAYTPPPPALKSGP